MYAEIFKQVYAQTLTKQAVKKLYFLFDMEFSVDL